MNTQTRKFGQRLLGRIALKCETEFKEALDAAADELGVSSSKLLIDQAMKHPQVSKHYKRLVKERKDTNDSTGRTGPRGR